MHIFRFSVASCVLISFATIALLFSPAKANDDPNTSNAVPVPVLAVKFQDQLEISSTWPATVTARRQSSLGFERGGLIDKIFVDVGDTVSKGDKLVSLNTSTQKADLAAANAAIVQARAQHAIAIATAKRRQSLADGGHISSQRLEESLANKASAEASLNAARAQARALSARLALSHIIAPFDGTILNRFFDEGAIAGPGTPVLVLIENNALELMVGLPADKAITLAEGDKVQISTGYGNAEARVRRNTNVLNPATQTVEVVFDFTGNGVKPLAGQSVRINLKDQLDQRGFLVPLSALREGRRGLWTLYALLPQTSGKNYILSPVPVEILYTTEQQAYVRGPIEDGTLILKASGQNTSVGMLVSPANGIQK